MYKVILRIKVQSTIQNKVHVYYEVQVHMECTNIENGPQVYKKQTTSTQKNGV
jgi:lantibiotic modifying enzyme